MAAGVSTTGTGVAVSETGGAATGTGAVATGDDAAATGAGATTNGGTAMGIIPLPARNVSREDTNARFTKSASSGVRSPASNPERICVESPNI
eukprot:6577058-Pyramimonas_sp.AAC.1